MKRSHLSPYILFVEGLLGAAASQRPLSSVGGLPASANNGRFNGIQSSAVAASYILVADKLNNRVCLFTEEGKFINNLLMKKHGINKPMGLAYDPPYLWVSDQSDKPIKCFKATE